MPKSLDADVVAAYHRDGFHFPVTVMGADDAAHYRRCLESYEASAGGPIHGDFRHKVHLLFTWADKLVRHPRILDAVEDVLGPNLLCWTSNFFIKEAGTADYVSWHQDSTYWGLSGDEVCTAWLALSDVPVESGAMKFWPGSHKHAQIAHNDTYHAHNLLSRGQEIAVDVPEDKSVLVPLKAGQISLHHVKLVHGSAPNTSGDRRIGYAIRYIPPHIAQLKTRDSATLVRGTDDHHHFDPETAPNADMDASAIAAHRDAVSRQIAALYEGTEKSEFRA